MITRNNPYVTTTLGQIIFENTKIQNKIKSRKTMPKLNVETKSTMPEMQLIKTLSTVHKTQQTLFDFDTTTHDNTQNTLHHVIVSLM